MLENKCTSFFGKRFHHVRLHYFRQSLFSFLVDRNNARIEKMSTSLNGCLVIQSLKDNTAKCNSIFRNFTVNIIINKGEDGTPSAWPEDITCCNVIWRNHHFYLNGPISYFSWLDLYTKHRYLCFIRTSLCNL